MTFRRKEEGAFSPLLLFNFICVEKSPNCGLVDRVFMDLFLVICFLPCVTYVFIFSALQGHVAYSRQPDRIQVPKKSDSEKAVEGIIDFWF